MCGIIGIVSQNFVNQSIFDGLTDLQHRGQDAAGIATHHQGQIFLRKTNGLVREVFQNHHMQQLKGCMGIGHIRYPTAGSDCETEAQPFYVNSPYGIALVHNGNLTNTEQLKKEIFETDRRHLNTASDSEVLLNVFAHELQLIHHHPLNPESIFQAISRVHQRAQGAYAVVAMIMNVGLIAFRDPFGIRPLIYGHKITELGLETMIASESVALSTQNFTEIQDILPGEAIFVDLTGKVSKKQCVPIKKYAPCIFEYVYLARPDTIMDKISVYEIRRRLGLTLASKILKEWPNHDIQTVIPIPETSRTSAVPLAQRLGVEYREGFVKNRYIGRTFIMPGQIQRKRSVRQKLNVIEPEFADKNVLLVDDSIVRGTTSREIIQMAREAGAKRIYFASCAPEVRFPNVYGIDMPAQTELVAFNRSNEEICQFIGADRLFYQSLEDLLETMCSFNLDLKDFECSIFDGKYIAGDINDHYLSLLEKERNDIAKTFYKKQSVI